MNLLATAKLTQQSRYCYVLGGSLIDRGIYRIELKKKIDASDKTYIQKFTCQTALSSDLLSTMLSSNSTTNEMLFQSYGSSRTLYTTGHRLRHLSF